MSPTLLLPFIFGVTMQFFLLILCCGVLAVSALSEEERKMFETLSVQCADENKLDPAILELARSGEKVDDENLKCFGACLMKNLDLLGTDGVFRKDIAIEKLPAEIPHDKAEKIINACGDKKGDSDCETAHLIFTCMRENEAFDFFKDD